MIYNPKLSVAIIRDLGFEYIIAAFDVNNLSLIFKFIVFINLNSLLKW